MSDSMREALEAAFNEREEETGGPGPDTTESVGAEATEAATETTDADVAAEVEASRKDDGQPEETPPSSTEAADKPAEVDELPSGEALEESVKPPQSWKLEVREQWGNVPDVVKQEIARRERDINVALQETANQRRLAEDFERMITPYQGIIAAQGSTPFQAIESMMNTAAGLTMGTPQQKAQLVARVISEFGVDIGELDSILAGQGGTNPQAAQLEQLLDQRLAPVQQFIGEINQTRAQHQQQIQQNTVAEIDGFGAKHEFFDDVRMDMADMIDLAANRGENLSLEQAYERAIAVRPDIQAVIEQRKAAATAQQTSQGIDQKRNAASSVRSSGQGSDQSEPETLRGALNAAFENYS